MIGLIFPVLLFSISTPLTPGPNNIIVMELGLGSVFQKFPLIHYVFNWVGRRTYVFWHVELLYSLVSVKIMRKKQTDFFY